MMLVAPIGGFQVARLLGRSTAWKAMVFANSAVTASLFAQWGSLNFNRGGRDTAGIP